MLLSLCCKEHIRVVETENGGYYVCVRCEIPCRLCSVLCFQDVLDMWGTKYVQMESAKPDKESTLSSLDGCPHRDRHLHDLESLRFANTIAP